MIGSKASEESRAKMRAAGLGRIPWNKGTKKPFPVCGCGKTLRDSRSKKCRSCSQKGRKNGPSPNKGIKYPQFSGPNHPKWKGGRDYLLKKWRAKRNFWSIQRARRKRGSQGTHTYEEWIMLKESYGNMCLCCKQTEPGVKLTEDHVIPLSKGGSNMIENIQPLCSVCNSIKHIKILDYRTDAILFT